MSKYKELTSLYFDGGYRATIFNKLGQYYEEKNFIGYTKKEVFYILRNTYNVIISRRFN